MKQLYWAKGSENFSEQIKEEFRKLGIRNRYSAYNDQDMIYFGCSGEASCTAWILSNEAKVIMACGTEVNSRRRKSAKPAVVPFLAPHPIYAPFCEGGYANGYVAVPENNRLYGMTNTDQADELVHVHGGVTFLERCSDEVMSWDKLEFLTETEAIPPDWWIVGFDTLHIGDNMDNCSKEKVIEMTLDLAKQLEKLNQ